MCAKKEGVEVWIRKPKLGEVRAVKNFLAGIGLRPNTYIERLWILDPGGEFVEAFMLTPEIERLLSDSGLGSVYSAGLNLGLIGKAGFTPSLHLARELSPLCGKPVRCAVLTPRGEKLFLYGREVYGNNVVVAGSGVSLVVSASGQPLGWGLASYRAGAPRVKPIRDLGWYLRRGG